MTDRLAIEATGIEKSFGETRAVAGASVSLVEGEVVALLGPSGSGKTTVLRVVAGFEVPDSGTVDIGGRRVVGDGAWVDPERRRVGMVFQEGALFPHLTVGKNVGFGNPAPGRVEECLALVGLADRARSYPHELSGGERQRVALARALAPEPDVVLLDEPFASLDAGLRVALREEIMGILRKAGASALLVTHDQEEALSVADSVTVMREGQVEQSGPPEEVYSRPASRWVAEFLGAADIVPGRATDGVVDCELGRFPADHSLTGDVDVVVRPEALRLRAVNGHTQVNGHNGDVRARVLSRSFYGHDVLVELALPSGLQLRSRTLGSSRWEPGDEVAITVEGVVSVLPAPLSRPGG